jgi:outer membrane protein assembly factor BamB
MTEPLPADRMTANRGARVSRALVLAAGWMLVPCGLWAQVPVERDSATASSVAEARKQIAAGHAAEGISRLQRIIETAGDELVPLDDHLWVPARWVCQRELAALPADALAPYRRRIDGATRTRIEAACQRHGSAPLEEILVDSFCATPTEEAIHLLADRAFEKGAFAVARRYWMMLLPADAPEKQALPPPLRSLSFPQPKTDAAAVRARLILIQLFRGESDQAREALARFAKLHPGASGPLAGQNGPYVTTLQRLLEHPTSTAIHPAAENARQWATFAGDVSRNSSVPGSLPYYWSDRPTWRAAIPAQPRAHAATDTPRALAFHPIVWNAHILLCDSARLFAFDLLTGKPANLFHVEDEDRDILELAKLLPIPAFDLQLPAASDLRYTLTAAEGQIYVRMGCQALVPNSKDDGRAGEPPRDSFSCVLCLSAAGGQPGKLAFQWLLQPPGDTPETPVIFEGTPIIRGDRLYVATWRLSGGETISAVACFAGAGGRERPELLWQRDVGKTAFDPTAEPRRRHELLALSGDRIVYCSPGGMVVALDARTGKPAWEYRYPQRMRKSEGTAGRDVCPCLAADGRIFAAPADADRVFCLDALTGCLLWESRPLEVIHLLGVTSNRLICTLDRPLRGITGLDVETGSDRPPRGWLQHEGDGVATFGRGFVADDVVLWPTRQGLQFLSAIDGAPLRPPLSLGAGEGKPAALGNLIFADGCLIAAGPLELCGFVAERRLLDQRRKEVDGTPNDAAARFRLAAAEADAGAISQASASFRQAAQLALAEGNPRQASRAEHWANWALADDADRAARRGDIDSARQRWKDLAAIGSHNWSAYAQARLANLKAAAGNDGPAEPPMVDQPNSKATFLRDEHGVPRSAAVLAARSSPEVTPKRGPEPAPSDIPVQQAIPDIGTRLHRAWHCSFEGGLFHPLHPIASAAENGRGTALANSVGIFLGSSNVVAQLTPEGTFRRLTQLHHQAQFGHLAAGALVVAGTDGVSRLRLPDGAIEWEWLTSDVDPLPIGPPRPRLRSLENDAFAPVCSSFRVSGSRIFCLLDRRTLVALDMASGDVAWSQGTSERGLSGAAEVSFGSHYYAGDGRLLVQCSTGAVRIIDATSGKLIAEVAEPAILWANDPIRIGPAEVLFSSGAETLVQLDMSGGRVMRRVALERTASLSGASAQLRATDQVVLVGTPRNHGLEVQRFDPQTGRFLWPAGIVIAGECLGLDSLGLDSRRLYCADGGVLAAYSLDDGKPVWQTPLPSNTVAPWRILMGRQALLLYPERSATRFERPSPREWLAVSPLPSLVNAARKSYHAWVEQPFPVWLADAESGRWLQRLQFTAMAGLGEVVVDGQGLTVVAAESAWGLRPGPPK